MENISNLIKEAKPLYFKKKRQEQCIKVLLSMMIPMFAISGIIGANLYEKYTLLALSSDTAINSMGLPTDEYGLLKVN